MIQLVKGDIFFVETGGFLGKFINWGQKLVSADNVAKYNHVGMFKDSKNTLESLWKVETHNFFDRYKGKPVVIVRPKIDFEVRSKAIDTVIREDFGERYPWYRFFILVAPPLAKYIDNGRSVCSELTAKYLHLCGLRHKYYQGTTPDKLIDEIRVHKEFEILFEGSI